jgi:hypothetical protein
MTYKTGRRWREENPAKNVQDRRLLSNVLRSGSSPLGHLVARAFRSMKPLFGSLFIGVFVAFYRSCFAAFSKVKQ